MKKLFSFIIPAALALTPFTYGNSGSEAPPAVQALSQVQVPQLTETPAEREARIQWFRDAKFGLFIHWGPASLSGEEISWGMQDRIEGGKAHQKVPRDEYMNLYRDFNPVNFDADEIMALAEQAGMTYSVFVTKHHDGFSLWDTQEKHFPVGGEFPEHYSISDTPYQQDIVKMVRDAAQKHGLKVGWYYSTRDWTHPDYLQGDNLAYNAYYENQVEELLQDYGPVDILWFDHAFGQWDQYTIEQLYQKMYHHNPNLLVNNRAVRGLKNVPADYTALKDGDYDTPENRMGSFQAGRAWESCMILSPTVDHGGWSYRPDGVTRSLKETIRLLSSCITGDGNMLLNIAPLPDGTLRPEERAILEGIAPWTANNKEALYGTRGGPWINGDWGGSTYRGEHVYLHLFDVDDGGIELNSLPQNVVSVTTLQGKAIPFTQNAQQGSLKITIPKEDRDPYVTVVKLTLESPVTGIQYGSALKGEGAQVIPGTMVFHPSDAKIDGTAIVQGEGAEATIVNWSDKGTKVRWPLELDSPGRYSVELLGSATEIDSMVVMTFGKGKHLYSVLPVTGNVESFQRIKVGEVTFPNAERAELVIQPVGHKDWKPVQVKEVRLIPFN
ncbi:MULTISPECIES: alpha-L-fucosidase [unclassified Lentimonas]|uniref:alpha-L-fucosidase n=1 Tax=unclassified Lentimonas TaxID=2630993 RepID=UPI0013286D96|nr:MULTISPECIES: alpha-L-fucosidase [unclassified Lentimonas]CAA6677700.1 Alpha-L-fucosidase (EC [Lentimonas sp. CC4]CAA6684963.1 Alpha-L-fucosidase (EC [Lentimonas sp. CC6]CAA7077922.1 Alpha-L-fucosidase (EC [Lentimonas sp. CC4]CAA7169846.1 Alpha-L-fucosidase (EC [Lentimonas sp. CC21]CAA7179965.1 Alpha-L-fucosidase (EC [Lentimonas sp. CC8]